nr:MAG: hypothetical protein [Sesarmops intermedium nimavirus]
MDIHHHRSDKKQSKAEKKRKREEKEAKRTDRQRKRKEKRAQHEIEKFRRLLLEEQQENPPRNVLTANSMRAAVEGIEAAIYDLGGVGRTGKKIPIKDVLRVTKMVAAALFADDVEDFIHNYLQDFRFDTVAVDLIVEAVETLNTAYERSADILGRENVECEYVRTCTTPFHQPSTYKEAAPLSPAPSDVDTTNPLIIDEEADGSDVDTTNPLIIDEEAEENNRENQEKTAQIKKRMLDEENDKIQTRTPVKNDGCFYMINTSPTEDEATEDDDVVGGGFSLPHRPTAYDTPSPREQHVFRIPVGTPPSARRVGRRTNNNAGRPLRVAAILARQREQLQRLTTGGFDSSFSSTEQDFFNDDNYEPVTTDFGSDSEFDIEEVRRLRV